MKRYLFSYTFDGERYSFVVLAKDLEEAMARVRRMAFSRNDGELVSEFQLIPNWFRRLFTKPVKGIMHNDGGTIVKGNTFEAKRKREWCPKCGAVLKILSSGIKCSKCSYWFCY